MRLMDLQWVNLWTGVYRGAAKVPTVVVSVRLQYWALPFSLTFQGHVITKPGLTFGFGPLYLSWCRV